MPESTEPQESKVPLAEVGRYARLAEAREHGLVIAARELPHWIRREGEEWVLFVEEPAQDEAVAELQAFASEGGDEPPPPTDLPAPKIETISLYVAAWVMAMFFLVQTLAGEGWMRRGEAVSDTMLNRGEWWRAVTALTLHGDVSHLAANLATGLIFAAFVIPHLGIGAAWMAILATGALGNAINAWGYRGEPHSSIGSSTAVFGALGILVGAEFVSRLASPRTRSRWQLVLPLGAGLALLAYLGAGDEQKTIDFMAHWWGFAVGLPLGAAGVWLRVRERAPRSLQRGLALLALVLPTLAWWVAWRR